MAVTAAEMRKMALTLPEAEESSHFGKPDFRVAGKIFATLTEEQSLAMVKLKPDEQHMLVESEPKVFAPVPGGWGLKGSTHVNLKTVSKKSLKEALLRGWRNVAPKTLLKEMDGR